MRATSPPTTYWCPPGTPVSPQGLCSASSGRQAYPTKIESGSIWIVKDSVAAKSGAVISPKLASLLSKLGIKPIRAGLSIALAYENGLIYAADAVAIDLEKYRESLLSGYVSSKALAVYIGYLTADTAPEIIAKAYREAFALAVEAGLLTPESAPAIIGTAEAEANALLSKAKEKGYA